jgi:hypothetical protein
MLDSAHFKDLKKIFSYIFTDEHCLHHDSLIIKDLSSLLITRSQDSIIVVECDDNQVDEDVSVLVLPERYDGDSNYENLRALKLALKGVMS